MRVTGFAKVLLLLAALIALSFASRPSFAAPTLVLVSGTSPFASCTIGGGSYSVVYGNAEVEPYVAVNPTDHNKIIGVWQQDRWNDGGARGLVAGYSSDGGATWAEVPLPFSACANGLSYERASDPWVSFGPDGTAYAVSLSFDATDNKNAIAAAVSMDSGHTWTNVAIIIADNPPNLQFFNDKESVTADPTIPGVAYVVWERVQSPYPNPASEFHVNAIRAPTYFAKTTDYGLTWSSPKIIVNTPSRNQTLANQIVVDPTTGTLYNFFEYTTTTTPSPPFSATVDNVAFVKSTDGGRTWTKPMVISDMRFVGVTDPNTGRSVRAGVEVPEATVDPATGQLYVVWEDSRFNGGHYSEVVLSTSSDQGATWSNPIRVNTVHGVPAFTPAVAVGSDGTVAVTYYDFRDLGGADYWFTTSADYGATFGGELQLAGPFSLLTAPGPRLFLGDYQGLTAVGSQFMPFFVQANTGNTVNPTDVFSTTVP